MLGAGATHADKPGGVGTTDDHLVSAAVYTHRNTGTGEGLKPELKKSPSSKVSCKANSTY